MPYQRKKTLLDPIACLALEQPNYLCLHHYSPVHHVHHLSLDDSLARDMVVFLFGKLIKSLDNVGILSIHGIAVYISSQFLWKQIELNELIEP